MDLIKIGNMAKSLLIYNPETGVLMWGENGPNRIGGKMSNGKAAGYEMKSGYITIGLCRHNVYAHRLAWLLHYGEWPDGMIDHINHIKSDNRIENLRCCTKQQNAANMRKNKNNKLTSSYKGVFWNSLVKKWQAQITVNGVCHRLGAYSDEHKAAMAYRLAAKKYFGDFHHAPGVD